MNQLTANELRIGNVLNYGTKESGIFKPTIIDWSDIRLAAEYPKEFNVLYHRIPLTEDVLLRFGFELTDDYGDIKFYALKNRSKRHYYVCIDHECLSFGISVNDGCTCLIYDDEIFQYAHHLQNIYRDFGHELEFKPE